MFHKPQVLTGLEEVLIRVVRVFDDSLGWECVSVLVYLMEEGKPSSHDALCLPQHSHKSLVFLYSAASMLYDKVDSFQWNC